LQRTATELRGLKFRRPVASGTLGPAELRRWVERRMAEELSPDATARLETALKAFGLIPSDLDLARFFPDLLTEQLDGFYDTRRKVLVLVRQEAGPTAAGGAATAIAGRMEEAVLVHELTHALQDQ